MYPNGTSHWVLLQQLQYSVNGEVGDDLMNEKLAFGLLVVLLVLVGLYAVGVRLPLADIFRFLSGISRETVIAVIVLAGIGALVALAKSGA